MRVLDVEVDDRDAGFEHLGHDPRLCEGVGSKPGKPSLGGFESLATIAVEIEHIGKPLVNRWRNIFVAERARKPL